MGRALTVLCVLAWACGGGSGSHPDGNTGDGTLGGDGASGGGWSIVKGAPATLFTVEDFNVVRYVDVSGDGDANEVSERSVFYAGSDDAYTLLPIDQSTVIRFRAGSSAAIMLHDLDGNGDTTGVNEAKTWWHGAEPNSGTASYIYDATRGSDGTVHVLDSDATSAIYALKDLNQDGDVDDAGEVTLEANLGSGYLRGPMTQDPSGDLWFVTTSTKDLMRVHNGTATVIGSGVFIQNTLGATLTDHLAALPDGSLVIVGFLNNQPLTRDGVLAAIRDANGNGTIEANEISVIWAEKDSDYPCTFEDLRVLDDGSLIAAASSRICRFVDGDQNGSFSNAGEVHMAYDRSFANQYGQTQAQTLIHYAVGTTH